MAHTGEKTVATGIGWQEEKLLSLQSTGRAIGRWGTAQTDDEMVTLKRGTDPRLTPGSDDPIQGVLSCPPSLRERKQVSI